ncbi:hypothetical protein KAW18_02680 [candidate division WOR-3 bacterium]|nr:hypothetical protein [candidate division WOR-3 bacterium]
MTSLQDKIRGHKTQLLSQLENLIAVNDDGQLDIKHLKIVANAIVENHKNIDWNVLDKGSKGRGRTKILKKLSKMYNDDKVFVYDINCD